MARAERKRERPPGTGSGLPIVSSTTCGWSRCPRRGRTRGDFRVLAERGRRALRVHLGPDLRRGLERLRAAFMQALN